MALLKGRNPECDEAPRSMVRWNVQRVRRGLFRRERIEVSVDRLVPTPHGDAWIAIDPSQGELLTSEEKESLVSLTVHDLVSEVVLAKLAYLVRGSPQSVGFVVDILRCRLHKAIAARVDLELTVKSMTKARKQIEQERDEAKAEVVKLASQLSIAEIGIRECVRLGYRATSIASADGETIERGDNAFLGTDPERRLILIDCAEAICAESRRVVSLPDGVPVFAKRDNARAWKRSQRNPISSPVGSGAPAVPAMPTDSPGGTGDGAGTAAGEADLLSFIGVQP